MIRLITQAAWDLMTDVYQKVREGHRFDLLERGFQSATERNSSHTSVSTLKIWKKNSKNVVYIFSSLIVKSVYFIFSIIV